MNTVTLAQKIKGLRKAAGLSLEDAAVKVGVKRSSFGHYETGERTPNDDVIRQIAAAFGVPVRDLADLLPDEHLSAVKAATTLPYLGRVAAGRPTGASEPDAGAVMNFGKRYPTGCFALTVNGPSVTGFGVLDGDVVVVRPTSERENGKLLVIQTDGGYMLKGCLDDELISYDRRGPKVYHADEDTRIVGVLLETVGPRDCKPVEVQYDRDGMKVVPKKPKK